MMSADIGEYIVGAYLELCEECDFVDYNVRIKGGGLKGLQELDLVGINFKTETAYLCEVTTHIGGAHATTLKKLRKKHKFQKRYAKKYLKQFSHRFMFWSPYVPVGKTTKKLEGLKELKDLESIINQDYTKKVEKLRKKARKESQNTENPFFRMLQIMEHLR